MNELVVQTSVLRTGFLYIFCSHNTQEHVKKMMTEHLDLGTFKFSLPKLNE